MSNASATPISGCSLIWDIEITGIDLALQVKGVAPINRAANSIASSEDLLDGALEFLCSALETHLASDVDDGGLWQIAGVLDVLGLLTITEWLLQILDDKARCVGFDVKHSGNLPK